MSVDYHGQARRRARNALVKLVREFSAEMEKKLLAKQRDRWHGWGAEKNEAGLMRSLNEHVMRAGWAEDYVDVANFAAFLWFIRRKRAARMAEVRKP